MHSVDAMKEIDCFWVVSLYYAEAFIDISFNNRTRKNQSVMNDSENLMKMSNEK